MAYTDRFPIVNNFLETRLSADCDGGETTLYIESVDALPRIIVGRDYIPLVLRDAGSVREIVYVDSVDADSGAIVVKRGQEGTNATAWSAGSYVYCTVTADSFQRMRVNGFAPLADGTSGRPEISVTSSTTASIAGDYTAQIEVGMAVRVLAGDSVVEPNDATMGAIHISGVEYSGGVTTLAFQNVTLPKNVSGLDLGLSVAAAPMYHPDTLVADNDTTSQVGNVIRADLAVQKAVQEAVQEAQQEDSTLDSTLRAFIAEEVAKAMAAANAAQSSADAAQSSANAAQSSANAAKNSVPVGTVIAFAANKAPEGGFLLCNGSAVSRTTYAALFSAIGTIYGTGNGSSTFNLPNLTDKFIHGSGTAGTVKAAGLPNITGSFSDPLGSTNRGGVVTGYGAFKNSTNTSDGDAGSGSYTNVNVQFNASTSNSIYGESTTVQPPALTMRYYIKY